MPAESSSLHAKTNARKSTAAISSSKNRWGKSMRVLIIKMSSLGDIIHTLPALSDAAKHFPDIKFDWLVEAPFQEIPMLHPHVNQVIAIQLRKWRKVWWKCIFSLNFYKDMWQVLKALRATQYDYVIDAQGLLKSALIGLFCQKNRMGYSWKSMKEPLASLFYQHKAVIPWDQHAIKRVRALFALSLGYPIPLDTPHYGLEELVIEEKNHSDKNTLRPYYVFLHGTTWNTKHWPEQYWIDLGQKILARDPNAQIKLLWGNETERQRAIRFAKALPNVVVLSRASLKDIAYLLKGAKGIVTVDTGLGHFAAALGVPTISLYGPTDPNQCGTMGAKQKALSVSLDCAPCRKKICQFTENKSIQDTASVYPPCFKTLSPERVWDELTLMMEN